MRFTGLDHVVLTVRDLDETCAFYESLGAERRVTDAGRTELHVGTAKLNLHEAGSEFEPHANAPKPGSADICLLVSTPLPELVLELTALDADIVEGPVDRVGACGPMTSLYVRDPDGNLVELAHPDGNEFGDE